MKTIPTKAEVESWLRNSWSQVLVFFQKLRANKKVNEAVSQVQQRLGPELQKIRDDKRVQEAASKLKPHRRKLIAGGVGLFLIWAVFPSGSDAKNATIKYWAALNKIFKEETPSAESEKSGINDSAKESMTKMQKIYDMAKRVEDKIEALPMTNVDDDLLSYAHEVVEVMQKVEVASFKVNTFITEVEAEDKSLVGFDSLAKHFLRGFSGDFTSSFKEMDNLKGERKTRWHMISNELMTAMEALKKMQSDQMPLRALLTKRYGVEFR
jgi:hypothetical protein